MSSFGGRRNRICFRFDFSIFHQLSSSSCLKPTSQPSKQGHVSVAEEWCNPCHKFVSVMLKSVLAPNKSFQPPKTTWQNQTLRSPAPWVTSVPGFWVPRRYVCTRRWADGGWNGQFVTITTLREAVMKLFRFCRKKSCRISLKLWHTLKYELTDSIGISLGMIDTHILHITILYKYKIILCIYTPICLPIKVTLAAFLFLLPKMARSRCRACQRPSVQRNKCRGAFRTVCVGPNKHVMFDKHIWPILVTNLYLLNIKYNTCWPTSGVPGLVSSKRWFCCRTTAEFNKKNQACHVGVEHQTMAVL